MFQVGYNCFSAGCTSSGWDKMCPSGPVMPRERSFFCSWNTTVYNCLNQFKHTVKPKYKWTSWCFLCLLNEKNKSSHPISKEYYLIDDVTVFSVNLGDCSKIPEDTKRLIELKQWKQVADSVAGRETTTTTTNNNNNLCVIHLRVGALIFIFVGHEEEEGVHTWNANNAVSIEQTQQYIEYCS